MVKILLYLPLHLLNIWIRFFPAPRWLFKLLYSSSSESIREQEQMMRNQIRIAKYYIKRGF